MRVNVEPLAGRRIFHVGSRRDGLESSRLRMGNKNRSAIPESSDLKFHKSDSVQCISHACVCLYKRPKAVQRNATKRNETQRESQDAATSCKQVNKWWEWPAATTATTFTADPMVRWWRRVGGDPRGDQRASTKTDRRRRCLNRRFVAFIQSIAPRATLRIVRRRV